MGTVPTVPTFTVGQILTAAECNELSDALNFWAKPPRCYAYRSAALSIANTTWVSIGFDAELYDDVQSGDSPMHDNSTNNSRIYARTTGRYEIQGAINFTNTGAGGVRAVRVIKNGSTATEYAYGNKDAMTTGHTFVHTPTTETSLTAGDYIELQAYQQSGGSLALTPSDASKCFVKVKFVAET